MFFFNKHKIPNCEKKKLLPLLFLGISYTLTAQVGIGNVNPHESSLLDIRDGNGDKGMLVPSVNITDLASSAPITTDTVAESLLVYNTNTLTGKGFHYWNGTQWVLLQTVGTEENIYNSNGSLTENRILDLDGNSFNISVATDVALQIDNNRRITFGGYGGTTFAENPINLLGVNALGQMVTLNSATSFAAANSDWYEEGTTTPPNNINDNIYTHGEVGIGTNNPLATLHIVEQTGTVAGPTSGTILLQHGNNTGESSLVFRSAVNSNSDYGYIKYQTDGSGNGSTTENSLLTIGVENDGAGTNPQDDININSSGSLGINTTAPAPSASIHMGRTNQGLLVNRVTLSGITDAVTIVGTEPDGLLVYNTTAAGTSPNNVVEGFYYWDSNRWNLLKADINSSSSGVQFYSYNITPMPSPNLNTVERETKISNSGAYTGLLGGAAAMAAMKPSQVDGFVIKIVGTYVVKNTGAFTFTELTDDGARIYIDGSLIHNVWADDVGGVNSSTITLAKGKHKFEFWYYENTGGESFSFSWGANPDGNTGVIQANQFTIE